MRINNEQGARAQKMRNLADSKIVTDVIVETSTERSCAANSCSTVNE